MPRPRFIALLLAFATLVVFLPVAWHSFLNYDDPDYVTDNPFVQNGLSGAGIKWAFTTFHAANWHPLTWISHQTDCELFGLNPGAHHLVNVLFHAANTALLFVLLWRLTRKLWASAMVAALFAWHPLHVESVAWVAERKDVLSLFFALLALLNYAVYAREKAGGKNIEAESSKKSPARPAGNAGLAGRSYVLALFFFTLSLLSKPMLVTLPFLLLLLDFWPLARGKVSSPGTLLVEKLPFFLLAFASCVVTFFAQKNGDAVVSLIRIPFSYRVENAPVSIIHYLWNFFWPANLNAIYLLDRIHFGQVIFSGGTLILVSVLAWHRRKTSPYFLFGWLWFLGTLVPVIGLIQVGSQSIADRYTYLPSIGFFIAVVFLAAEFAAKIPLPKIPTAIGMAAILAACIGLTEFQLHFWRDSETLFRRAIAIRPDNVIALVNLGVGLDTQSRFDEALAVYQRAEKFATGPYYQLHNSLGNLLARLGRHAESLAEYKIAMAEYPNDPALHNYAGGELAALGNHEAALKEFAIAGQLGSNYVWPHMGAAQVLLQLGRDPEALNELRMAVHLAPDNYQILTYTAHVLAANANPAARDGQSALALAVTANHITDHSQPVVYDAMGMACAELGDFTNAQACAETAIKLATAYHMQDTAPLHRRLELYQKNQPWRESFLATNGPAKN